MAAINGLEWMETGEALDLLRVSSDNLPLIEQLAASVPSYVEVMTGYPAEYTAGDDCHELVKQLSRFVLQLWFNPDGTDSQALSRVVGSLAKSVKALVGVGYLPANG
ncbi:Uncharacterised protein [Slackia heliotrinireducens]|uniref:Phage gp6-like head-tail connector protein n=1 Tax=Slackia heliotrinireducens (strain ATCC 29202 / DSM 20476 / NCTC 11029 / RHS 1) TaxID=471855 RepID=C7N4P3_SLAHD|nr:hypothetical protein [Slackia heliotrinireducens]ACV21878.1 hypothetical protein Shel_08220 [Slackia heliotrinireducens DSM 20476]VEG99653.1 Uncharacterised protein [Slackia heliotrinireducens]